MTDVALLFPPMWYYAAVPADLSCTAGSLAAAGLSWWAWNGSAAFTRFQFGEAVAALRQPGVLGTPRHEGATASWYHQARTLGVQFGADVGPRHLRFPDLPAGQIFPALARGLDLFRNPALPLLGQIVDRVLADPPRVLAIAVVHPDQLVQALALTSLLRERGFQGVLVWFGTLEDVLAPTDFAPDLLGDHGVYRWLDGVVLGDAGDALVALARGDATVPNLLRPGSATLPARHLDPLDTPPAFDFVQPADHPFPTPVVDLRLGRGCPWGRCRFCGIQAHHPTYRAGPIDAVVQGMLRAHDALGSTVFRVRDDLLTPVQLRRLGEATSVLPFRPRWSARARFSAGLTRAALQAAQAGGLEELSIGLESAVPRVRALMDKGVEQPIVERVIADCHALGIRLRLLCMVGYPGETEVEASATLAFLEANLGRIAGCSISPFTLVRSAPLAADGPRPAALDRLDAVLPSPATSLSAAVLDGLRPRMLALAEALHPQGFGPDPTHRWLAARPVWDASPERAP